MINELRAKLMHVISKFPVFSSGLTPNTKNSNLTKLNGSTTLTKSGCYNLMINGSATFESSEQNKKSNFTGIIVVNGIAKANNIMIESLEMNGTGKLKNSEIKDTLYIYGKALLKDCNIKLLVTYGDGTKVELINTVVHERKNISSRKSSYV